MTTEHERMDFAPPEWRIIQRTVRTKELQPQVGKFVHTLDGRIVEKVHAVIVDIRRIRTYWGSTDFSGDPPQCSSDDAASYRSVMGDDCRKCPYDALEDQPWRLEQKERREKCLPGLAVLGFELEEVEPGKFEPAFPFLFRAHGLSATPMRGIETMMGMQRMRHKIRGKNPPFPMVVMSTVEEETPGGAAYRIKVQVERFITMAELEDMKQEIEVYKALPVSARLVPTPGLAAPGPEITAPAVEAPVEVPVTEEAPVPEQDQVGYLPLGEGKRPRRSPQSPLKVTEGHAGGLATEKREEFPF